MDRLDYKQENEYLNSLPEGTLFVVSSGEKKNISTHICVHLKSKCRVNECRFWDNELKDCLIYRYYKKIVSKDNIDTYRQIDNEIIKELNVRYKDK